MSNNLNSSTARLCSALIIAASVVCFSQSTQALTPDQWNEVQSTVVTSEYAFRPHKDGYYAHNFAHGLHTVLSSKAVQIRTDAQHLTPWSLVMEFTAANRLNSLEPTASANSITSQRTRAFINRGTVTEWYANTRRGVEQGFNVLARSPGHGALVIGIKLTSTLKPQLDGDKLVFTDAKGEVRAQYSGLIAWDATGRVLPTTMRLNKTLTDNYKIELVTDDQSAVYPIVVDPYVTTQLAKLEASDAGYQWNFGWSVDLSADTLLVGARHKSGTGSAYIFKRNQGGPDKWQQQLKLTPSDIEFEDDHFGTSVALDGDTAVVGAFWDDDKGVNSGSVYIFSQNKGGADKWGQVTKLVAPDGAGYDEFGNTVAISGDTVAVGCHQNDDDGNNSGSVYLFGRNKGGADAWGLIKKLTATDATALANYGGSVAMSGDRLVVGAQYAEHDFEQLGAAYVYERNQGGADQWGEAHKLIPPSDISGPTSYGAAVAIDQDRILVGAWGDSGIIEQGGTGFLYERNQSGLNKWGLKAKINASDSKQFDQMAWSVSLNGEAAVLTARGVDDAALDAGGCYVFSRNQDGADAWGQVSKVVASDSKDSDDFGWSVASDGDVMAIGAYKDDDQTENSGTTYVYSWKGGGYHQADKLGATPAKADAQFGQAVVIDNDLMLVGAKNDNSTGAAFIMERNKGGAEKWGVVTPLKAASAPSGALFGATVALHQHTAVVGAPGHKTVYVYSRNQDGADKWGQIKSWTGAGLGNAVAISNDHIAVASTLGGPIAMYERNTGGANNWGKVTEVKPGAANSGFGTSLSMYNDMLLVGATGGAGGTGILFARNQGGADQWGQVALIKASDIGGTDNFGVSVGLYGETAVIGASNKGAGNAYVFRRNTGGQDKWGQVAKLSSSSGKNGDQFGHSVAIIRDIVVVGSPSQKGKQGGAYVYGRNKGGADKWGSLASLEALDGQASDAFGTSVSATTGRIMIGAPYRDDNKNNSGSTYVFVVTDKLFAANDKYSVEAGKTLTVNTPGVLKNDSGGKGVLTANQVSQPAKGQANLKADGSFTYTPNGPAGTTDSFQYQANDGQSDSNVAKVTIEITDANQPPIAKDDVASTYGDNPVDINVLSNDTDAESQNALVITSVTQPKTGTVTIDNDKKGLTFQSDGISLGKVTFKYTVSDGSDTAEATVEVTVKGCGDGQLDWPEGEECDDNNSNNDDGCDASCFPEFGFQCVGANPSICSSTCGDSQQAADEACDDGNDKDGDCCSSTCEIESQGTICRVSAGACDVPEACNGKVGACPADEYKAPAVECRKSQNDCDLAETCSGASPECPKDGFVTDGTECDDGDPCSITDTCKSGVCFGSAPNQACDDDNACTENDTYNCDVCKGTPIVCNDDNPCTDDGCSAAKGCTTTINNAKCDDGDACTLNDLCKLGDCVAGPKVNCDDDNMCTNDSCDAKLGCVNAYNTMKCDDNDPCTTVDKCDNGTCVGTTPNKACDDGDSCTENDTLQCDQCVGVPISCDDGNPCTKDKCKIDKGCTYINLNADCDDGNACTTTDECVEGKCIGSKPLKCEDDNPCTDTPCDKNTGCQTLKNSAPCDDGNACTEGDQCGNTVCQPGKLKNCDDANVCTSEKCIEDTGCTYTANSKLCDDGNECTENDKCADKKCAGAATIPCDDGNLCTDDNCTKKDGCTFVANTAPCDDNNKCTTKDACTDTKCAGGPAQQCDDNNPCTKDACEPDKGCVFTATEGTCDDNNPCTETDKCADKLCKGTAIDCSDDNECTLDKCEPSTGCINPPDPNGQCDDGNPCNGEETCDKTECVSGETLDCNDDNECSIDSCDPKEGCVYTNNENAKCSTGDKCLVDQVCLSNQCSGGSFLECNDKNPCTNDSCDPATGCVHTPTGPEACDDDNACTTEDVCSNGTCSGQPLCTEGQSCTDGVCSSDCGPDTEPKQRCLDDTKLEACEESDDGWAWVEHPCDEGLLCVDSECIEVCNEDTDPKTRCNTDNTVLEVCSQAGGAWSWQQVPCQGDAQALTCAYNANNQQFHCCAPQCKDKECGAPSDCEVDCGQCSDGDSCCLPGEKCAEDAPEKEFRCLDDEGLCSGKPCDANDVDAGDNTDNSDSDDSQDTTDASDGDDTTTEGDVTSDPAVEGCGCRTTPSQGAPTSPDWLIVMLLLAAWSYRKHRTQSA